MRRQLQQKQRVMLNLVVEQQQKHLQILQEKIQTKSKIEESNRVTDEKEEEDEADSGIVDLSLNKETSNLSPSLTIKPVKPTTSTKEIEG